MRALGLLCLLAGRSAAAPADGCPSDGKPRADTFGFAPDTAALLAPADAGGEIARQQLRSTTARVIPDDWLTTRRVRGQLHLGDALALSLGLMQVQSGNPGLRALGNASVGIGYRASQLRLGDAIRTGYAIQLTEGLMTEGTDRRPQLQQLADRLPFHEAEIAPDQPFTIAMEGRVELVGCHVPFLHLRAGFTRWRAGGAPAANVGVIRATFGGYERRWLGLALSLAVDLRGPDAVFSSRRLTEVAGLVDISLGRWLHLVLRAGAITGASTGVDLGVSVATTFLGGA